MSSPSTPAAPDYVGAAEETNQGNLQDLEYQTNANRVTQDTPFGDQTWSTNGSPDDPNASWTETTTLTPQEQDALNSQMQVQENQSNLGEEMEGQVASTMSQPMQTPSYSSYMDAVPGVNTTQGEFTPSGSGINTNVSGAMAGVPGVNTNAQGSVSGVPGVNTSAPTFDQSTADNASTAAYNAEAGMLQPEMTQNTTNLDTQLREQGLTPGTTAYDTAMKNLQTTNNQQLDSIANQSEITGAGIANEDYQSALSGYNAGNAAQEQEYGENMGTYEAGNEAQSQDYGEALSNLTTGNTAQTQQYGEELGDFSADQQAQQQANEAQNQDYSQALSGYDSAYQAAENNYLEPLNSMNAVLNGEQVSEPSFPGYSQEGYVPGTDYSTAAQQQGSWNQGIYNTEAANSSNMTSGLEGLAGTAAMAFALY